MTMYLKNALRHPKIEYPQPFTLLFIYVISSKQKLQKINVAHHN